MSKLTNFSQECMSHFPRLDSNDLQKSTAAFSHPSSCSMKTKVSTNVLIHRTCRQEAKPPTAVCQITWGSGKQRQIISKPHLGQEVIAGRHIEWQWCDLSTCVYFPESTSQPFIETVPAMYAHSLFEHAPLPVRETTAAGFLMSKALSLKRWLEGPKCVDEFAQHLNCFHHWLRKNQNIDISLHEIAPGKHQSYPTQNVAVNRCLVRVDDEPWCDTARRMTQRICTDRCKNTNPKVGNAQTSVCGRSLKQLQ